MRVEIAGLTKRYGRVRALDGVSLAVPEGRRVAFIGPNGSGKSTLTRAVMGLIAFEGDVLLDGEPVRARSMRLAERTAHVPQVAPQVAVSVGELAGVVAALRGTTVAEIARLAAALDLDVEAVRRRAFRDLSGGMKQKLLIALALAAPASLLILDEPTASLDPRAREKFFELFEREAKGKTLMLCSHRLEELTRLVDHVVLLEEGRVAYEGPSQDFLDARAVAVVEVRVPEARLGELLARGFVRGMDGWCSLRLPHREAPGVVRDLAALLGGDLADVVVRNLETVEPASAPGGGAGRG